MDNFKQKWRKNKQTKENTDTYPQNMTDVIDIKENLKIKEILRSVKMNKNSRSIIPPDSDVLSNNHYCLDSSENNDLNLVLSATNSDVQIYSTMQNLGEIYDEDDDDECESKNECSTITEEAVDHDSTKRYDKSNSNDVNVYNINGKHSDNFRDRKLSLDHAILSRQEGFSQSELDWHSIEKSPLERKPSVFRKKMNSFVRNTRELFRKENKYLQRQMLKTVSLQSLDEKHPSSNCDVDTCDHQESHGSGTSLHKGKGKGKGPPVVRSASNQSLLQHIPENSFAGSQTVLDNVSSPTFEELHSSSDISLDDFHLREEAMLKSRAISMNSGLDAKKQNPKTSHSKRVTWIASEGLMNYLRRNNGDEKSKDMPMSHSYQDSSCIPENEHQCRKLNTKGRRLSYQRAVLGEDPVRYQDSTLRRKNQIQGNNEVCG